MSIWDASLVECSISNTPLFLYLDTTKKSDIATANGKKIYLSKLMGFAVKVLRSKVTILSKAFGLLVYKDTEDFAYSYCKVSFDESIGRMYQSGEQ